MFFCNGFYFFFWGGWDGLSEDKANLGPAKLKLADIGLDLSLATFLFFFNLSSDIVLSVVSTETGILGAPVGLVNPLYSLFGKFYLMLIVNNIHSTTPFSLNHV